MVRRRKKGEEGGAEAACFCSVPCCIYRLFSPDLSLPFFLLSNLF
jgi:hypothetical protein